MGIWTIEGNERLEQEIRTAARRGTLGSAFILSGGADPMAAARFLTAAMECRGGEPPCGRCAACR